MLSYKMRESILDFLVRNKKRKLTKSQLFFTLQLTPEDSKDFEDTITELRKSELVKLDGKRIFLSENFSIGHIQSFSKNEHYVYVKGNKYKIVDIKNAIHGDKVVIRITDKYLLKADVVSIIRRKNSKIAGIYVENNGIKFVLPENNRYTFDIYIKENTIDVKNYDKVLISIDEHSIYGKPEGILIKRIIDNNLDAENALDYILDKYEIEKHFPPDVVRQDSTIVPTISKSQIENRVDLRGELIFTIDGKDAKDLDDAISVKKTEEGYELGVYIADVSYYVPENSPIDKNARKRGNTYYLQDDVIPMLPTSLSNHLCSLNPKEDKLCIGLKLFYDNKGNLLDKDLFECIVNSKKGFSYEEINDFYENTNLGFMNKNRKFMESLNAGMELAGILREKRIKKGYISFDTEEPEFVKDSGGEIIDIKKKEKGISNRMIEEFMIAANETIAEIFAKIGYPFIYRIHQEPFEDKLDEFFNLLDENNVEYKSRDCSLLNIQEILNGIEDENLRQVMSLNFINSMKQAIYSNAADNHFGLSSDAYCHFTSPIRRYPDLYIHRIVRRYIHKTINNDVLIDLLNKEIPPIAKHCSYTEKNADRAEEEYDKIKIMNYLSEHPDNTYDALVYKVAEKQAYILIKDVIFGVVKKIDMKQEHKVGESMKVSFERYDTKSTNLVFKEE